MIHAAPTVQPSEHALSGALGSPLGETSPARPVWENPGLVPAPSTGEYNGRTGDHKGRPYDRRLKFHMA